MGSRSSLSTIVDRILLTDPKAVWNLVFSKVGIEFLIFLGVGGIVDLMVSSTYSFT